MAKTAKPLEPKKNIGSKAAPKKGRIGTIPQKKGKTRGTTR